MCCRYTTTPKCRPGVCVSIVLASCVMLLVSSGSPESRTQHYAVISRVRATGPRLPCANVVVCQVGMAGLEPAILCSQSTWVCRYPTSRYSVRTGGFEPPISWSPTRRDTRLRYVLSPAARTGVEPASRLEGPAILKPIDERAMSARTFHAVDVWGSRHVSRSGWEVLESASAAFQAAATPSQLPTQ